MADEVTLDDFVCDVASLFSKSGAKNSNHQWKCLGCKAEFKGSKLRALAHVAKIPGEGIDPCKHKWTAPEKSAIFFMPLLHEAQERPYVE